MKIKLTEGYLVDAMACDRGIKFWQERGALEDPAEVFRIAAEAGELGYCDWLLATIPCNRAGPTIEIAVAIAEEFLPIYARYNLPDTDAVERLTEAVGELKKWLEGSPTCDLEAQRLVCRDIYLGDYSGLDGLPLMLEEACDMAAIRQGDKTEAVGVLCIPDLENFQGMLMSGGRSAEFGGIIGRLANKIAEINGRPEPS